MQEQLILHSKRRIWLVVFIFATVALILTVITRISFAVAASQSGSVSVSATVDGNAPNVAAHIKSPSSGTHFSDNPVKVTGSCQDGTIIHIYKNNIFAGSTQCQNGKFTIKIDLVFGKNVLVAKTYDSLNQKGPDSDSITVYYDTSQVSGGNNYSFNSSTESTNKINQLIATVDKSYQGAIINQDFFIKCKVSGGVSPYALYISWGDTKNDLILQPDSDDFNITHKYEYANTYNVLIKMVDSKGNKAYIQTVIIVNGKPVSYVPSILKNPETTLPAVVTAWQIYIIVVFSTLAFWLGEKYTLKRYIKHRTD